MFDDVCVCVCECSILTSAIYDKNSTCLDIKTFRVCVREEIVLEVFITSSNYSKNRKIGKENISLAFYCFSYNQFYMFSFYFMTRTTRFRRVP